MKLSKKSLYYFFSVILILLIIGAVILFQKRSASYEGQIYAAIESEIRIGRDKNGIPFVNANTLNDAYFSIGFLHAQDRLTLIEYFRAIARGRLSELIGKDGIFPDKLALTIGFARKAETIMGKLKSPYNDYLDSYVKGINASRKQFYNDDTLKGVSPADWTAKDVISILLLFECADSFLNNRELIFPLPDKLNAGIFKEIIPGELFYQYPDGEKSNVDLLIKIRNIIGERIGSFQEGFAFYISGKKMEDGKSVSGFTLDSDISIYPKWYTLNLIVGETRIDGVTVSGLPFILFGRNDDISFYGFNINVDAQDFCLERTRVINDIQQYYRNGRWYNFTTVNERLYTSIKQKEEDGLIITVRATDIGPVISDLSEKEEESSCMSLNLQLPDESYINSLFDIPFTGSAAKAERTVWNINSLPRIYLFACNDNAAYVYSGKIIRRDTGKFFQQGNVFAGGFVNLSGYGIKSAENDILIGNEIFKNAPGIIRDCLLYNDINRYDSFKRLIEKDILLSSKNIASALHDSHSVIAERFCPVFLAILEHIPLPSAKLCKIYFNNWNFKMDSDSVAATIFNSLLANIIKETIDDEMGDLSHILTGNYYYLIDKFYELYLSGNSSLFDDISTKDSVENREDIFDRAFMKTLRYLNKKCGPIMENWKWGTIHKGHFIIPLAKDSFFRKNLTKLKDFEVKGDNFSMEKGAFSALDLKPSKISIMSGIFYLDLHLSFFSMQISPSLDPGSEYFLNNNKSDDFITIDAADIIHKFTLLPYGK